MVNKYYLGIDPGMGGGLATISDGSSTLIPVDASPMPKTERDIWNWICQTSHAQVAMIEKVQGYIGNAQPGSAMFKFGMSYGGLRMALIAASIPFEEVTPQKWQKALGIAPRKKNESKGQFKNRLKAKAQQLYPNEKVTLATADALLIATYCKRKHEGTL